MRPPARGLCAPWRGCEHGLCTAARPVLRALCAVGWLRARSGGGRGRPGPGGRRGRFAEGGKARDAGGGADSRGLGGSAAVPGAGAAEGRAAAEPRGVRSVPERGPGPRGPPASPAALPPGRGLCRAEPLSGVPGQRSPGKPGQSLCEPSRPNRINFRSVGPVWCRQCVPDSPVRRRGKDVCAAPCNKSDLVIDQKSLKTR